jgi:L-asparaginase
MVNQKLPKVRLYSLGGTISSAKSEAGKTGVSPSLDGQDLIKSIPGIREVADVDPCSFSKVASGDLNYELLFDLASQIQADLDGDFDGVVVTQGTDTTEETVFVLDLLVDSVKPVVVTGAMRNPTLAGPDGPANVLASVVVASSPKCQALGSVVVFNDEIHAARFVRKTHTSNPATFKSPGFGPIGYVVENKVRVGLRPTASVKLGPSDKNVTVPKVALVKFTLGDDDGILSLIERSEKYKGLVIEGFGGGHVPSKVVDTVERLAQIMPVILTSRTGAGEVLSKTYSFPGSESDLLGRGLISSGGMNSLKAKIILTICLAKGLAKSEIDSKFLSFD